MEFLTVHETARLLKVTPITIRRYIASGRLPAVRVGRRVRVQREAVEAFIEPAVPRVVQQADGAEKSPTAFIVSPLTDEEVRQGLAAIKLAQQLTEKMRAERGGKSGPESWPLIREAREERAGQI
jgi:excisionase family DNA binding protein